MHYNKEKIIQAIYRAADEINAQFPPGRESVPKSLDTVLFGKSGYLDSLGLVNLIIATEQHLEDSFGVTLTLADERALVEGKSPFSDIRAFADYIAKRLRESESD